MPLAPEVVTADRAVVTRLASLDVDRMTPLEALTLLAELKALVDDAK